MGKSGDPEGEATATLPRPRDPKMQAAKVQMLNGTSKDFELHRGSDGEVLFTLVTTELSIEEREYFSLCFYDENGLRHWLYNDKKILKQLKGLPWEFSFEVKFYPTSPTTLNDDNARYNLFLQLRKDVASGRLPATIPTHATLGAYVAQAEYGDADSSAEYERYLKDSQEVPNLKDQSQLLQLLEKVKEVHREQKGLTAAEAESKYLDTCKQLSMYGVFVFDAKDDDNNRVGVGICATGINIYKETIRVHRFAWQNIVKISYKKNAFSVKLKAGELDKKEVTLSYKVQDYLYAKRVWKCGVEHHTFFRLIQPEDKPKTGIFHWGSTRFRYQGRTQFQTKMASQMFDHTQSGTVRSTGNRLSQSYDNGLNKENVAHYEKSATLGRDGQQTSPIASPGVSYEISSSKRAGTSHGKSKKSKKSKGEHENNSSESSSSDDDHVKVVSVVENSTVERTREQLTPIGAASHTGPIVDTQTRSVVYESNIPVQGENENLGEFVSSKTVTSGNRTIETITYKTERDGIIETHVEHRVTIHSDVPIDHDAELSAAIAEATQMNPDMTVEKIEVRQETST